MNSADTECAYRKSNIYGIGVPKAKERENEAQVIFEEVVVQKCSELMKDTNPKIQETHKISRRS